MPKTKQQISVIDLLNSLEFAFFNPQHVSEFRTFSKNMYFFKTRTKRYFDQDIIVLRTCSSAALSAFQEMTGRPTYLENK
jgi:hypothetical protein